MHLWQVSLAGDFGSLIGHLQVAFGGDPNFNVADNLDGAYFGSFNYQKKTFIISVSSGERSSSSSCAVDGRIPVMVTRSTNHCRRS